jgi:TfoX/Sxy family transcriptional regulator of competence genes
VSYDPEVADRVRQVLADQGGVTEKKMVGGGLSFLVNGNMCCGVRGPELMVRIGRDGREHALGEPHVRPMLLGGRALSGFINVEPAGFAADDALASWVRRGLDVAVGLPAKPDRRA